jgi:hypothetical protein
LLGYQLGTEIDRGGKDVLHFGKAVKSAQVDYLMDELGTTSGDAEHDPMLKACMI